MMLTLYATCRVSWCSENGITKQCEGDGTVPIICGICGHIITDVSQTPPTH